MCCFFSNNGCCNRNRSVPEQRTFNVGPRGPQGPAGVSATQNALYATANGVTVAAGSIVPLTVNTVTPNSSITASGGEITVLPGYYFVEYGFSSGGSTNSVTLNLLRGNTVINTLTAESSTANVVSKSLIVYVSAENTLSIVNGGTTDISSSDFYITVIKLT